MWCPVAASDLTGFFALNAVEALMVVRSLKRLRRPMMVCYVLLDCTHQQPVLEELPCNISSPRIHEGCDVYFYPHLSTLFVNIEPTHLSLNAS